jgi:gliding motility-associated-like protein
VVTASPTSTTTYTVTGTNTYGCSSTQNVTVTVNPLPTVSAGATPQQFCNTNIPVTLTGYNPAGGTWSGTGVTSGGVFTPAIADTGSTTLTYTVIDNNNCSNSASIIANVITPQIANAGNGFNICTNANSAILNGYTPSGGTWSGLGVTGATFDPVGLSTGLTTLTYSIGSGTCLSTDTILIQVNPLPTVSITPNAATICVGQNVSLTASGASTYSWSPSTTLNASNTTVVVATPVITTAYTVVGISSLGCANTDSISIHVNQLPIVEAGINQQFCNTNTLMPLTGATPLGGTWSGIGVTASDFNPSILGVDSTYLTYSYTYVVTGCSNTDSLLAIVISPTNANAGNGFSVCKNHSDTLLQGATPAGGIWSGNNITSGIFSPNNASPGISVLTYTTGSGSCQTSDTLQINVVSQPILNVTANPLTVCNGTSATLNVTGASTYVWLPTIYSAQVTGASSTVVPLDTAYFSVIGTNTYGCSTKDSIKINVNQLPIVNAGLDEQYCNQNIPIQLTGFSPANGVWSGLGVSNSGQFNPSITGLGIHDLIYTFTDANGCVNSDTMKASVAIPIQANAGLDTAICQTLSTFIFQGSPTNGIWSGLHITSSGVFTPDSAGTYILTYTFGTGTCKTTDTKTVIVHPLPLVNIGPDISTCITSPSQLLFSNIGGGIWAGNGIVNTSTGLFTAYNAGVGITDVTYQITSSTTGCVNTDTVKINVHDLPIPQFDSVVVSCLNVPIQFANNTVGSNTYVWYFGDGSTSTMMNPQHTYADTGIFHVKLVVTSQFGCVDSTEKLLIVTIPPVSNFSQSNSMSCGPLSSNFINSSIAQYATYQWSFGNGNISSLMSPSSETFQLGSLGDTTYFNILMVTNNCGISTHVDSIIVLHEPVNSLGLNVNSGCSPLSIQFTNTTTGSNNTYNYDFGNGITSSSSALSFQQVFTSLTSYTTYYIQLIATNICGVDSLFDSVTVHPNTVNAAFNTFPLSGCSPLHVAFTNYSTTNCNYYWNFGNGNVSSAVNTSQTFTTIDTASSYTIKLIITDGCSYDTAVTSIQVNAQPNLAFTISKDSICAGNSVSIINQSQNLSTTSWNFGDGLSSSLFSPTHTFLNGGNFNVTLIGTSALTNCSDTLSDLVTVIPKPIISLSPIQSVGCEPYEFSIVNNSQFSDFYSWNFGDGNTGVGQTPQHTYDTTGLLQGQLIASNFFNCIDSTNFYILVNPKPTSSFNLEHISRCTIPDTIKLINNSIGAIGSNWSFGDGAVSTLNNPTHIYSLHGDYPISLIAISDKNCSDTLTIDYKVKEAPIADFNPTSADNCKPIIKFENLSQFAMDYLWLFSDGLMSTEVDPIHDYQENYDSSYVYLITDPGSLCSDTIKKLVHHSNGSHPYVWIPNAFTPNADGLNDKFELVGFDDCDEYNFRIFDRWGNVVFETSDLSVSWDGSKFQKDAEAEVYNYIFQNYTRKIKKYGKIILSR